MSSAVETPGRVLIASHGEGRGRDSSFLPLLLDEMSKQRPALFAAVHHWQTGDPIPPLENVQAVIFILADPIMHHPQCAADAGRLAEAARARGVRLLNPPGALDNTLKNRQARRWKAAGLNCAAGLAAANEAEARAALARFSYPVILRSNALHVQRGVTVCYDEAEAVGALPGAHYTLAVLKFIDTREGWRRRAPGSIFAEYYHKRRSMVFGSRVVNNHIFFSTEPVVGSKTSTFNSASKGVPPPRMDEMIAADIAYSRAPAEAPATMQAAMRALRLDIAAIDYSTMPDGSVVLWEANPYFHLPHWSEALFAQPRRLHERIPRMLGAMMDELQALSESSSNV